MADGGILGEFAMNVWKMRRNKMDKYMPHKIRWNGVYHVSMEISKNGRWVKLQDVKGLLEKMQKKIEKLKEKLKKKKK